ncbi:MULTISPECIES: SDR family NAD(P)-dependent oxidoreductase [Ponticoccus]|uniref:SDR family oxidoreductase n=1 Tax=Ponticoccus litoralis TaxID=422297 RepID=A0AAW9SPI3_9RHOB
MSNKSLSGKVAVITGAGSPIGLGYAMAEATLREGGKVAMLDVNAAWLEESAARLKALAGDENVLPIQVDITDPKAAEAAIAQSIETLNGLDILVNNAGLWEPASFREVTVEAWQRIRAVNLDGPFYLTKPAVEHMIAQGSGRIVNVTTSLGTMWTASNTTYGSSKAGHEAMASVLALELEGTGVTCNVLIPGGNTATNMSAKYRDPDIDTSALMQNHVMSAPYLYMASDAGKDFNCRRVVAALWDEALPLEERLAKAAAPIAWPQLGGFSIEPKK